MTDDPDEPEDEERPQEADDQPSTDPEPGPQAEPEEPEESSGSEPDDETGSVEEIEALIEQGGEPDDTDRQVGSGTDADSARPAPEETDADEPEAEASPSEQPETTPVDDLELGEEATARSPSPAESEETPSSPIDDAEMEPVDEAEPTTPTDAEIEDADVELVEDEAGQAYREPGVEDPEEASVIPSAETRELVEEVEPDDETEIPGIGDRRKPLHGPELEQELGLELAEPITPVPEVDDPNVEVVDLSEIRKDLSYVRLLFDEDASRYLYQVIEPPLTQEQREDLSFIRETLVQTLSARDPESDVDWQGYLQSAVERVVDEHGMDLDPLTLARANYYLERDFLGYGPIDTIMQDPMIEDISCDGPGVPVYVFHREHESVRTNVVYEDESHLDGFVRSLAQRSGRHISIAEPLLDATLPDTSRLQATLSDEVTTRGSSFTIRRFRSDPLTTPDLVRLGTMSARMAAWIWMAIEAGSPMLVAGGTASGKTTTLSSMTQFIPPAKKVVTIEDTREFSLVHENWVASLTRAGGFGEGEEREIDMYKLLETALRQRPEYLIVGEVRGSEAQTLFQAMATGHATYSTMHADSVRSAVYRLENPPIDIPRMMLQTLDAVIVQGQTRVGDRLVRRILDITEITGIDDKTGDMLTNQVYRWNSDGDEFNYQGRSNILEALRIRQNVTVQEIERDWERRARVIDWMVEQGIRHIMDVSRVIAAYYASPERLIDRIEQAEGAEAVPDASEVEPLDDLDGGGAP